MNRYIYVLIFTFLSSVAFSSNKQIIPNGNYEFTWKAYFVNDESTIIDFLATE